MIGEFSRKAKKFNAQVYFQRPSRLRGLQAGVRRVPLDEIHPLSPLRWHHHDWGFERISENQSSLFFQEEAKAEAAEALINDTDDKGAPIQRPGILTDKLPSRFIKTIEFTPKKVKIEKNQLSKLWIALKVLKMKKKAEFLQIRTRTRRQPQRRTTALPRPTCRWCPWLDTAAMTTSSHCLPAISSRLLVSRYFYFSLVFFLENRKKNSRILKHSPYISRYR